MSENKADDKGTLRAIQSDVIPLLERIKQNTRTRAYKRRTGGYTVGENGALIPVPQSSQGKIATVSSANSSKSTRKRSEKQAISPDNSTSVLTQKERVAKAEQKAADSKRKAAIAESRASISKTSENKSRAVSETKSANALKENRERTEAAANRRSFIDYAKNGVGAIGKLLPDGNKDGLGDAAGVAGMGVYYTALKEITDTVSNIRENGIFGGVIGDLKNKYTNRNDKGQYISKAERAQELRRNSTSQGKQESVLGRVAKSINSRKEKSGSGSSGGDSGGIFGDIVGGIIGGKVNKILGGTKVGKWLGLGSGAAGSAIDGAAGSAIGGAGTGLIGRAIGGAGTGLIGRAIGGLGLRAVASAAPWVAGTVGAVMLINEGLDAASGALTGGKYAGEGWLGSAIFDLGQSIKSLTSGVDANTKELEKGQGAHFASIQGPGALQGAVKSEDIRATSTSERIGKFVDNTIGYQKDNTKTVEKASKIPNSTEQGWKANKDTILGAADVTGADAGQMAAIAQVESNFDPKIRARTSSAGGLYQFTDSTWNDMIDKYGAKYGLDKNASKYDAKANALMGGEYIKKNQKAISSELGREANTTDVYMGHFLGTGGAVNFLKGMQKNPNTSAVDLAGKKAASDNRSIFYDQNGRARTAQEVYSIFENKLAKTSAVQEDAKLAKSGKQNEPSASQVAENKQDTYISPATVQMQKPVPPLSIQQENEKQAATPDATGIASKDLVSRMDKLIAIQEEMKKNSTKKEGDKDVDNSPNIPMEYEDSNIVLMARDRA